MEPSRIRNGDMTEPDNTRWLNADGTQMDEDHRGLVYDVQTLVNRRAALGLFGGVALTTLLAACAPVASGTEPKATLSATPRTSPSSASPSASPSPSPSASTSAVPITEIPDETGGPYPADNSNGVNILDDSGIVRSDIRSSFGSSTTTAAGVPLQFSLTIRDAATGNAIVGVGVYAWHCDAAGNYSLYSGGVENENYLRGVQQTDPAGTVTFTSIFPACYPGRWPHIHFEVYADVATAVAAGPILKTSQLALPKEACDAVYATTGYESSARNLGGVTLTSDNVFGDDGGIFQIATVSGDVTKGYTAALAVGI